jgi:ABC-type multidrug transport system fused ATPase/permease subunit
MGILVFLALIAGFSFVAMLIWNAIIPGLFSLPLLNYWQALGLVVLFRIFTGRFGHGLFHRHGHGFHHGNRLREKWRNMSEEERKAFIEQEKEFRNFFHGRFSGPETNGKGNNGK